MKRVLLLAVVALCLPALSFADGKNKKTETTKKEPVEIQWITSFKELEAKMQKEPRKVYIDAYTDWCGWCKKMDATTFSNEKVIKYMNRNYYCVKFNAERKDTFQFQGKLHYFEPQYKCNTLAAELMRGQMSYPTTILMMENFQNPQPIPGYLTVSQMEYVVSYFGDNAYKHQKWEDYQKTYKATWDGGAPADMTPPGPTHR